MRAGEEGRAAASQEEVVLVSRRAFSGDWNALFRLLVIFPMLTIIIVLTWLVAVSPAALWLQVMVGLLACAAVISAIISTPQDLEIAFPVGSIPVRVSPVSKRSS